MVKIEKIVDLAIKTLIIIFIATLGLEHELSFSIQGLQALLLIILALMLVGQGVLYFGKKK